MKILKWTGIIFGALFAILVIVGVLLYFIGGSRIDARYDVAPAPVEVLSDSATIARGRHLAGAVALCNGCHGDDLSGDVLLDDPMIATIYASNLTSGRGGVGGEYSDIDLVRAVRHGVNKSGRGLMIMHSDAYHNLSVEDLGAIVAYVKSVSPVDNEVPPTKGGPLGRIFVALGFFDAGPMPLIPAEIIDHSAPPTAAPPAGVSAEYGRYLVSIGVCGMCHGPDLNGGPPIDEGAPPGPNITVYGSAWPPADFVKTIRTGVTPYGKELNPDHMPWKYYAKMTDDELLAIQLYLSDQPSKSRQQ